MTINAAHLEALNEAAGLIQHELIAAQKAFVKLPNATNWQVCLRAMFTHQQINHAIRSHADVDAAQKHLRIMTGWHAEILRLLEEEDKHG